MPESETESMCAEAEDDSAKEGSWKEADKLMEERMEEGTE